MAVTQVDVGGSLAKGLQVNQMRQQLEANKQQQADQNRMRELMAGGIPTDPAQRQGFVSNVAQVNPSQALDWGNFFQQQDSAKLKQHQAEAPFFVGALQNVQDEAGYQQARAALSQKGVDVSDLPPNYDQSAVNMALQGYRYVAGIQPEKAPAQSNIAKLIAERDALPPDDPRRATYDNAIQMATTRAPKEPKDPKAQGEGGPFGGTGMDAQVMNILLQGNPASPEYLAAYNHYAAPKMSYNSSGQLVTIKPDMSAFRPPAGGGGAQTQPVGGEGSFFGLEGSGSPAPAPQPAPGGGVTVEQVGAPILTEGEKTASGFATRLQSANTIIDKYENIGAEFFSDAIREWAPNVLKSADRQRLEQAQRDFVNAVLRQESGAVISDEEFANAAQQYFPQAGDSPEAIAQKRAARKIAVDNMRSNAGRATVAEPPATQQTQATGDIPPPPPGFVPVQ